MTAVSDPVTAVAVPAPSPTRTSVGRRFLRDKLAVTGLVFAILIVLVALAPGFFAPHDPASQELLQRFKGPSGRYWLGTDSLGRDILSRTIYGARTSMLGGLLGTTIALVIGVPLGVIGAYYRGRVLQVLDRINDVFMSIPALLLAIVIVASLGPSLLHAMTAIGIAFAPRFYRISRAATQDIRGEMFIEASQSLGCSGGRIVLRHVFPNIVNTVIIQASLTMGSVILTEANLSFLGLGVQPPTSSWGLMLKDAASALYRGSYQVIGPGVMVVLTVLACQFAADGLRNAIGGRGTGRRLRRKDRPTPVAGGAR